MKKKKEIFYYIETKHKTRAEWKKIHRIFTKKIEEPISRCSYYPKAAFYICQKDGDKPRFRQVRYSQQSIIDSEKSRAKYDNALPRINIKLLLHNNKLYKYLL